MRTIAVKLQHFFTFLSLPAAYVSFSHAAVGTHKWAVVLLDYCDSTAAGNGCDARRTLAGMTRMLKTRHNSVVKYFNEASYNKFHIDMEIFGWIQPSERLPAQQTLDLRPDIENCYPTGSSRFQILKEKYPEVRLRSYHGFLFLIRRPNYLLCFDHGYNIGYPRQLWQTFSTPARIWPRIAMTDATIHPDNDSKITSPAIVRSILHSYGITRGDLFSIMGYQPLASLPNPVNLESLGWIDVDDGLTRITQSGLYMIHSLENQEENVKALRIDTNNNLNHVYIHYRGFTGFDDRNVRIELEDGTFWTPSMMDGALVHAADCSKPPLCTDLLLDMHPNDALVGSTQRPANSYFSKADALLYEGETKDLDGLTIETVRVVPGQFIIVRILLGEVPSRIAVRAVTPTAPSSNGLMSKATRGESLAELFDWDSGWEQEINFDRRVLEFNDTDIYQYREHFLQYLLEAKTTNITADDCPNFIELEPFDSTQGGGSQENSHRDLSEWTVCINGPLEFIGIGNYGEAVYCTYESMEFDIFLYNNEYVPCEDFHRHI